tara:strand:+ start:492 stop:1529 length:1038 start_codon:yes stop_codon:yes gene_type:complete
MTRKKHKNYSKTTQKMGFSDNSFYCNCCDYLSSNNSNYKKHLRTKKHLENYSNFSKTSKSLVSSKNKFFCVSCDYSTSRKSNWTRHIKSIKHLKKTSKKRAKQPAQDDALPSLEKYNELLDEIETLKMEKKTKKQEKKENFDMEMLKSQINKIIESQNEIKEEVKSSGTTINNYNNISITVFLEDYCHNAKSVQEFLKNVSFELNDIISNNSLIEDYLSKKLIKNLEDLPFTERPIHCTDNKRKNFMVKDEAIGWVKDNGMDSSGSLYNKMNSLQDKAYIEFFNEYDKANPLPHDTEKERIKCQISSDMITNKDKNNKNAIVNIANTMSITDAIECSLLNNKIND